MAGSNALRGCVVWRTAIAEVHCALGAILLGAILLGVSLLVGSLLRGNLRGDTGVARAVHAEPCHFEQDWCAGDVHLYERLYVRANGTGTWMANGHAPEARPDRKTFGWTRTATTLTVTYDDGVQRTVPYTVKMYRRVCLLTFEYGQHPFRGEGGFTHFHVCGPDGWGKDNTSR